MCSEVAANVRGRDATSAVLVMDCRWRQLIGSLSVCATREWYWRNTCKHVTHIGTHCTVFARLSPNSITPTFQQSLHTLSKTQIMKVCRDKVCRLLLFVSQISHVLSCTKFYYSDTNWFVTDFVITVLRWFVSTTFMVLVYHFQRNLFGERQSNGIWALASCLLDCYCPLVFSNVNFKLAKSAKVYLCKLLE